MRAVITSLLALAASTLAYEVIFPSSSQGWTDEGPQVVTWQRVDTDRLNFTIVLTNQVENVLPSPNLVLSALVDGTTGNTTVNPPSGGWPDGLAFRVNLVQDAADLNAILAQSSQFAIQPANTSTSIHFPTSTNNNVPIIQTATADPNAPGSGTNPPNAASSIMIPSGVLSVLAAAVYIFA